MNTIEHTYLGRLKDGVPEVKQNLNADSPITHKENFVRQLVAIVYIFKYYPIPTQNSIQAIPKDTQNEHYRTYLSWKAEGRRT